MNRGRDRSLLAIAGGFLLAVAIGSPAIGATPIFTSTRVDAPQTGIQPFGPAIAAHADGSVGATWWLLDPTAPTFSVGIHLAEGSGGIFSDRAVTANDDAYPTIAYDTAGVAHIAAYVSGGGGGLVEIDDAAGTVTETVVTSEPLTDRPSIAVAPNGTVEIAYAGGTNPGVFIASNAGSGWSIVQVASGSAIGPRMTIDASNNAHVAWVGVDPTSGSTTGIQYATESSGSFAISTATTNEFDASPDIAVSGDGTVHIVFTRNTGRNAALMELRGQPGQWRTVRLARGPTDTPDIELDPSGHEHVAYASLASSGGIRYVTNASGHFVNVFVANGQPGPGLAVTSAGVAYIDYTVPGTGANPGGVFVAHD